MDEHGWQEAPAESGKCGKCERIRDAPAVGGLWVQAQKQLPDLEKERNIAMTTSEATRRSFLKTTATFTAGISSLTLLPGLVWSADDGANIIGPKSGYP